jgi:hypothetical protein
MSEAIGRVAQGWRGVKGSAAFPDVAPYRHAQAGRSGVLAMGAGSTRDMACVRNPTDTICLPAGAAGFPDVVKTHHHAQAGRSGVPGHLPDRPETITLGGAFFFGDSRNLQIVASSVAKATLAAAALWQNMVYRANCKTPQ